MAHRRWAALRLVPARGGLAPIAEGLVPRAGAPTARARHHLALGRPAPKLGAGTARAGDWGGGATCPSPRARSGPERGPERGGRPRRGGAPARGGRHTRGPLVPERGGGSERGGRHGGGGAAEGPKPWAFRVYAASRLPATQLWPKLSKSSVPTPACIQALAISWSGSAANRGPTFLATDLIIRFPSWKFIACSLPPFLAFTARPLLCFLFRILRPSASLGRQCLPAQQPHPAFQFAADGRTNPTKANTPVAGLSSLTPQEHGRTL